MGSIVARTLRVVAAALEPGMAAESSTAPVRPRLPGPGRGQRPLSSDVSRARRASASRLTSPLACRAAGVRAVGAGAALRGIGVAVEAEARHRRVGLLRNLGSHGAGWGLHEAHDAIPTWDEPRESHRIRAGMVFTIEPFGCTGADAAMSRGDGWTLTLPPPHRAAQGEPAVVATSRGALFVTRPRWRGARGEAAPRWLGKRRSCA